MNCKEFQEQISAAVDRYLKDNERRIFEDHAGQCPPCRHAYQNELRTKALVHAKLRMVHAPETLVASIVTQLGPNTVSAAGSAHQSWADLMAILVSRPVLVGSFALLAVALIVTQPSLRFWESTGKPTSERDVIQQSLANYQAMVEGSIKPQLVSSEPESLLEFFSGKTDFQVHVPAMKECILLGGSLNDLGGEKVAHVMYQRNSRMIYVYQVCREMAMKGEQLSLPANVQSELQRTGWFTQALPTGEGLVLWVRSGTLCTAVAQMSPTELVTILQSEEQRQPW